jgi:hypothetical protein
LVRLDASDSKAAVERKPTFRYESAACKLSAGPTAQRTQFRTTTIFLCRDSGGEEHRPTEIRTQTGQVAREYVTSLASQPLQHRTLEAGLRGK